jgi:hypothetical protein
MGLRYLPEKRRSGFPATSAQGVNGYAKNEDEEDFGFAS